MRGGGGRSRRLFPARHLPGLAILAALLPGLPGHGAGPPEAAPPEPAPYIEAVLLPGAVISSMNERFVENNEHWDEAPATNGAPRPRIIGTQRPTQLEYMGCLQGKVAGDTLRISGWIQARDLVQFQFGVDGSCEHVPNFVGTWHTHPYRLERLGGDAVKQRTLSEADLKSFRKGRDLVIVAMWDVDSLDVATRGTEGEVIRPVRVVVDD